MSPSEGQFTIYNSFNCNVYVNSSLTDNCSIGSLDSTTIKYLPVSDEDVVNVTLKFDDSCSPYANYNTLISNVTVSKGKVRNRTNYLLFSTFLAVIIILYRIVT